MSKAPAMPMYWDAYLADTTHLTTEEHGAYMLLLGAMWRRDGSVPDNDADNARILGLTKLKWRRMKDRLSGLLIFENDTITQEKLRKTWKKTQEKIEVNTQNGAKGGRPKPNKNNDLGKANGSNSVTPIKTIPEPEPEPYKETKVSSSKEEMSDYEEYLKVHPNPVRSKFGETEFFNLIKSGETSKQIISAARAYAEKVAGWSDLGKVQQSDNFICADRGRWRDYVPSATTQKSSRSDLLAFWADAINKKRFVPVSSIKADFARDMVSKGLVTVDQLNEIGISL